MKHKFHMTAAAAALALFHLPLGSESAHAAATGYKEKNIHDFCALTQCLDGATPVGDLVLDSSGNIYGTTAFGGAQDGVVFELKPYRRTYKFVLLWAFGVDDTLQQPVGDLILDKDGNLYGTAYSGGSSDFGAVFELKPNGSKWSLSTVYEFSGGSDGGLPPVGLTYAGKASGQPWDESSPLYGTAIWGGKYGNGVVYQLVFNGSYFTETTIHNFQTSSYPTALIEDPSGNLWGTTQSGGTYGGGLMYRLASGTWKVSVSHYFCISQNCADGADPVGRLFMDSSDNIFGTTYYGGSNCGSDNGCGVAFELTAGGTYQVLYNFCSAANCTDGAYPLGGVIMNASGNLVGTTAGGGSVQYDSGVAFELTNSGSSWNEAVLHAFCSLSGCTDGEIPNSDPVADTSGRIFAVTQGGGVGFGNVFKLTPSLSLLAQGTDVRKSGERRER